MSQKRVEEWCRKRKRCWSLPLSVFAPAVIYDNWFRCMCRFYSRELILQDPEHVGVYSLWDETSYISQVAEIAEIKNYCRICDDKEEFFVTTDKDRWKETSYRILLTRNSNVFTFDKCDLAWTALQFHGYDFLPYDLDVILYKLATLQTCCLRAKLPDAICFLIAHFAKDQVTIKDCYKPQSAAEKEEEEDKRSFRICTKPKHFESIKKARINQDHLQQ